MTQEELMVQTALAGWKQWTDRLEKGLAARQDESLEQTVAPGKNRIRYIVGHLAAVNDRILPSLGMERLHPELDAAFLDNPDGKLPDTIPAAELKRMLLEVDAAVTARLEALQPGEWLERHAMVSAEDFAKEPLRNRLALVLSRTSHVAMHVGQLVLVK